MAALQPAMFPEIVGADFVRSEAVADVAEDVLRIHGVPGTRLQPVAQAIGDGDLHVLYLLNAKPLAEDEDLGKHDVAGKCIKAPALWRDVTGYDVAIWIRGAIWRDLDEQGRRAILMHELLHVDIDYDKDNQPKLALRKHDVEGFVDVAKHYGPIEGEGAAYVRAATVKPAGDKA